MPELPSLKKRINNGETLVGLSVPITTEKSKLESMVAGGPYDFVVVDSQHTPLNEERVVSFCEMAAGLGLHVQLRIKHTRHTYLVGNYLDLGPSGVEVPQVESETTANEAIANFYYPPDGVRSWGGRARAGLGGRADRLEYAGWWKRYGVLWLQIESVEAVTAAGRLAKPGVDCLSFGPADLSFSLESHPYHPFKTVDGCVSYTVRQLEETNVAVCFRNAPGDRQKYIDMGVRVLLEAPA